MRWSVSKDTVTELRIIEKIRGRITSGYFNDPVIAANAIMQYDNAGTTGIYCTLNPTAPEILDRCTNRLELANIGLLTKDTDIILRRELLLDFDAKRKTGISSTDGQHLEALARTRAATDWLAREHGFPLACLIDSGNGGHGRYRLEDGLENMPEVRDLIRTTLHIIADRFDDELVELDKKVFNASRICRIPGTVARKGDNTIDRPHRQAKIIRGFELEPLRLETLLAFVKAHSHLAFVTPTRGNKNPYPPDEKQYTFLNNVAKNAIHDWVPHLIGQLAHDYEGGYQITQDDLNRELQERIMIYPNGSIMDFGVADMGDATNGSRTPISLLAELLDIPKNNAATMLADVLGITTTEFGTLPAIPLKRIAGTMTATPGAILGDEPDELAYPIFYHTIRNKPVKPIEYLIERLIVLNTHTVLSGPSKMGKTTLTYEIVLHLLFGKKFLGREVVKCNVLYLALEEREDRFHRKMQAQLRRLTKEKWPDITEEEIEEAFKGLAFVTRSSKIQDGRQKTLPVGFRGADSIRNLLREYNKEWPGKPWLVVIEPVILFSEERLGIRNLNKAEYEQIEIINDIIRELEYTCAVLTVKHDRKSPAGGVKGMSNLMDATAGSVAQQGAPDAQIQLYSKEFYRFTGEISWIVIQSRDFGKEQFPIVSNGVSWEALPPGHEIPDFRDYLASGADTRGAPKKDAQLENRILNELSENSDSMSAKDMSELFNISEQIVRRTVDDMVNRGMIVRFREARMKAGMYRIAEHVVIPQPVAMPRLRDVL
jgi:hypothetical protein